MVVLSTTEAEYITAVEASKEVLWLRGLVEIFWHHTGFSLDSLRLSDCYSSCQYHKYHKRTKHNDVRYHKICQRVVDDQAINLLKTSIKKKFSIYDDKGYPGGKVQSISKFHPDSPK